MSEPTTGERSLAEQLRTDASALAAARDVINAIAQLPWPPQERISLLARLARAGKADVGPVLSGVVLGSAPLKGLDLLVPLRGIGVKRVAGLARALASVDIDTVDASGVRLRAALATIAGLRGENDALRTELDRLRVHAAADTGPSPASTVMAIGDLAGSVGTQASAAADLLRSRARGLRLGAVDLHIVGTATATGSQVALDLASPAGGSAVGLSFVPGESQSSASTDVDLPDVVGYTTALAQRKLAARGFAVAVASVAGARGVVSAQTPGAHTRAPSGSLVRLIVK